LYGLFSIRQFLLESVAQKPVEEKKPTEGLLAAAAVALSSQPYADDQARATAAYALAKVIANTPPPVPGAPVLTTAAVEAADAEGKLGRIRSAAML
jgi:hypothetical protein